MRQMCPSAASGALSSKPDRCERLRLMELSVGPLAEGEWQAGRAVAHRAFVDEPFTVEMYGEQILDRCGGSWGLYASMGSATSTLALGARGLKRLGLPEQGLAP